MLLPRRGELRETRNDHQVATLNWLRGKPGVHAAFDEQELRAGLEGWQTLASGGGGAAAPKAMRRTQNRRRLRCLRASRRARATLS